MAVMMHDMKAVYWGKGGTSTPPENKHLQLRFDVDPLSCIVALADVLQDFERPNVKFSKPVSPHCLKPEQKACLEYETEVSSTVLEYDSVKRTLEIYYKCAYSDRVIKKNNYLINDRQEYFDPRNGYLDLSACGIEQVQLTAMYII